MSERPEADKATTTAPAPATSTPTAKPPERPTTVAKPGAGGSPDDKSKKPPRPPGVPEGAYGWVTHPDGYIVGKDVQGNTFMYNPNDRSTAHWDAASLAWRDPDTGDPKPPGWDAGHGGQIELGGMPGGFTTTQEPTP